MKIFVGTKFQSSRVEPNVTRLPFVPGRYRAQNARKDLCATIYRPAAYPFYFRAVQRNIYIYIYVSIEREEKLYSAIFRIASMFGKRYVISTFSRFAPTCKWISFIIKNALFFLLVFTL